MNSDELKERRQEAQKAMESDLQRHIRESRDELAKRQRAATEEKINTERRVLDEQARKRNEAAQSEMKRQALTLKAAQARAGNIARASQMVESLQSDDLHLNPLRTFKGDMARAVREEGLSLAKIAVTGQGLRGVGPQTAPRQSHLGGWLGAVIISALVAGGGYYAYVNYYPTTTAPPTAPVAPPPLIFSEINTGIDLTGATGGAAARSLINQEAARTDLGLGAIKNLYFTRGGAPLGWSTFRQAVELNLPDDLSRTLDEKFMFGLYQNGSQVTRFLIIEPKLFELAYSGMWQWERSLIDDAFPLINGVAATGDDRAQSWSDKLVHNKDARLVKNQSGETVLFYAFLDPHHLVITRDEATFLQVFKLFTAGTN